MAALVQQGYTSSPSSSTNTVAATMTLAQSLGNCNVVFVQLTDSSATVTVSDTKNGAYTQVTTSLSSAGHCYVGCFVFPNIAAATAGSNIVTATSSLVTGFPEIIVEEWSGLVTSGVVDVSATTKTTAQTGNGSVPITTTNANDVILTGYCNNGSGWTAAGTGFTLVKAATATSGNIFDSKVVTSTGTYTDTPTAGGTGNTEWSAIAVALKVSTGGTLNPSLTAGTVSVSGSVSPSVTPVIVSQLASIGITAVPGVQAVYYPSLSGAVSVVIAPPSSNPGGQPVTFNPVAPNLTGTMSFSGVANPVETTVSISVNGNVNITGSTTPGLANSLSGSVAVSGTVTPTFSPVFPNVSGVISETGVINFSFGPVTTGLVNVTGGINNIQLGPSVSGTAAVTGVVNTSLGITSTGTINVVGTVNPTLPTMIVNVSGLHGTAGVINPALDPGLGISTSGLVSVSGSVFPTTTSITINISGTLNITGAVLPEPIFSSGSGPINVTGAVTPAMIPPSLAGSVSVSGSVVPTITPIFVTLSGGLITVTGGLPSGGKGINMSLIGYYDFWGGGFC